MINIQTKTKLKFPQIKYTELFEFLADHFNIDVETEINFLINNKAGQDCNGYAMENFGYVNSYRIKTARMFIDVIAHEFIHINQYDKGQLSDAKKQDCFMWQGQIFKDGLTAPWEMDAIIKTINLEKELDKFIK